MFFVLVETLMIFSTRGPSWRSSGLITPALNFLVSIALLLLLCSISTQRSPKVRKPIFSHARKARTASTPAFGRTVST
jgi:hypothetical protein